MNTKKLVRIAMFAAMLFVGQVGLSFIPNVEVVSLLILCITLVFEKEGLYASFVFVLLEGVQWGFGLWWFSYLYVWPILYFIIIGCKKINPQNDFVIWAIILGFYGLTFGGLFALAYIPVSINYAITYWIAGLTFDVIHAVSNVIVTLLLAKPTYLLLLKIKQTIKV